MIGKRLQETTILKHLEHIDDDGQGLVYTRKDSKKIPGEKTPPKDSESSPNTFLGSSEEWLNSVRMNSEAGSKDTFAEYFGEDVGKYESFMHRVRRTFHMGEIKTNGAYGRVLEENKDAYTNLHSKGGLGHELMAIYQDHTLWRVDDIGNVDDFHGKVYSSEETVEALTKLEGEDKVLMQLSMDAIADHIESNAQYNGEIMENAFIRYEKAIFELAMFQIKKLNFPNRTKSQEAPLDFYSTHARLMKEANRATNSVKVAMGICLGKHLTIDGWVAYLNDAGLYQTDGNHTIVNSALLGSEKPYSDSLNLVYLNSLQSPHDADFVTREETRAQLTLRFTTKLYLKRQLVESYLNKLNALGTDGESSEEAMKMDFSILTDTDIDRVYWDIRERTLTLHDQMEAKLEHYMSTTASSTHDNTPISSKCVEVDTTWPVDNIGPKDGRSVEDDRIIDKVFENGLRTRSKMQRSAEKYAWEKVLINDTMSSSTLAESFNIARFLRDKNDPEGKTLKRMIKKLKLEVSDLCDRYMDHQVEVLSPDLYISILMENLEKTAEMDGEDKLTMDNLFKYNTKLFHLRLLKSMIETIDSVKEETLIQEFDKQTEDILRGVGRSSPSASYVEYIQGIRKRKKEKLVERIALINECEIRAREALDDRDPALSEYLMKNFVNNYRMKILSRKNELLREIDEWAKTDGCQFFFMQPVDDDADKYVFPVLDSSDGRGITPILPNGEYEKDLLMDGVTKEVFNDALRDGSIKVEITIEWRNLFYIGKLKKVADGITEEVGKKFDASTNTQGVIQSFLSKVTDYALYPLMGLGLATGICCAIGRTVDYLDTAVSNSRGVNLSFLFGGGGGGDDKDGNDDDSHYLLCKANDGSDNLSELFTTVVHKEGEESGEILSPTFNARALGLAIDGDESSNYLLNVDVAKIINLMPNRAFTRDQEGTVFSAYRALYESCHHTSVNKEDYDHGLRSAYSIFYELREQLEAFRDGDGSEAEYKDYYLRSCRDLVLNLRNISVVENSETTALFKEFQSLERAVTEEDLRNAMERMKYITPEDTSVMKIGPDGATFKDALKIEKTNSYQAHSEHEYKSLVAVIGAKNKDDTDTSVRAQLNNVFRDTFLKDLTGMGKVELEILMSKVYDTGTSFKGENIPIINWGTKAHSMYQFRAIVDTIFDEPPDKDHVVVGEDSFREKSNSSGLYLTASNLIISLYTATKSSLFDSSVRCAGRMLNYSIPKQNHIGVRIITSHAKEALYCISNLYREVFKYNNLYYKTTTIAIASSTILSVLYTTVSLMTGLNSSTTQVTDIDYTDPIDIGVKIIGAYKLGVAAFRGFKSMIRNLRQTSRLHDWFSTAQNYATLNATWTYYPRLFGLALQNEHTQLSFLNDLTILTNVMALLTLYTLDSTPNYGNTLLLVLNLVEVSALTVTNDSVYLMNEPLVKMKAQSSGEEYVSELIPASVNEYNEKHAWGKPAIEDKDDILPWFGTQVTNALFGWGVWDFSEEVMARKLITMADDAAVTKYRKLMAFESQSDNDKDSNQLPGYRSRYLEKYRTEHLTLITSVLRMSVGLSNLILNSWNVTYLASMYGKHSFQLMEGEPGRPVATELGFMKNPFGQEQDIQKLYRDRPSQKDVSALLEGTIGPQGVPKWVVNYDGATATVEQKLAFTLASLSKFAWTSLSLTYEIQKRTIHLFGNLIFPEYSMDNLYAGVKAMPLSPVVDSVRFLIMMAILSGRTTVPSTMLNMDYWGSYEKLKNRLNYLVTTRKVLEEKDDYVRKMNDLKLLADVKKTNYHNMKPKSK